MLTEDNSKILFDGTGILIDGSGILLQGPTVNTLLKPDKEDRVWMIKQLYKCLSSEEKARVAFELGSEGLLY